MTNYLQRHRRPEDPLRKLAVFGGIAAISVGVLVSLFAPSFFPGMLQEIGHPLWEAETATAAALPGFLELLRSKRELVLQNRGLRTELADASLRLSALLMLAEENRELKKMLGRAPAGERVAAGVLVRPNQSPYDTLIIDAGENLGITKGSRVVFGDIAIGTVERVFKATALVKLFSTPGETIAVQIGSAGVSSFATGKGGGTFEVQLPRGAQIVEGDSVSAPGIHATLLGFVEKIFQDPADPFITALFRSPANLYEIRFVEIERGEQ